MVENGPLEDSLIHAVAGLVLQIRNRTKGHFLAACLFYWEYLPRASKKKAIKAAREAAEKASRLWFMTVDPWLATGSRGPWVQR